MQIIPLILAVLIGAFFVYVFIGRKKQEPEKSDTGLQMLLQQINELQRTVDQKLGDSEKSMRESMMHQSNQSTRIITDITERLTRLDETNKQVMNFTDQLKDLQDILKNPKQRGVLGEYYLETLLKNVLPPGSFEMQYQLGVDEEGRQLIPDAVV
jgi:DNA recombination protein RmuC